MKLKLNFLIFVTFFVAIVNAQTNAPTNAPTISPTTAFPTNAPTSSPTRSPTTASQNKTNPIDIFLFTIGSVLGAVLILLVVYKCKVKLTKKSDN